LLLIIVQVLAIQKLIYIFEDLNRWLRTTKEEATETAAPPGVRKRRLVSGWS
jgi:hypothetical protein